MIWSGNRFTAAAAMAAVGVLAIVLPAATAAAQSAQPPGTTVVAQETKQRSVVARPSTSTYRSHQQRTEQINQNTVTVISGNPNGTYLYLAYDLSAVLDDGDTLRVLPIIGKGGYQNVLDVLHLKGIDLGITQSNIMTYLKRTGELGANIDQRLAYIAKLYNEEMHILAGPGIEKIEDLSGKVVNFSDIGSGTQFSTRLIFEALGIKAQEINVGQADGFLKVKSGEIAATVLIAGKPAGSFAKFKLEPGMKLLPMPYATPLEADYFPAVLTHEDYPNLVEKGRTIETIAVGAVLAVYNWPRDTDRYRRVAKFTDAFFDKIDAFSKPPRHSKWRETNLAQPLKGWLRFPSAQERLDKVAAAATGSDVELLKKLAARAVPGVSSEQERLFRDFLEWRRQQQQQQQRRQ